MTMGESVMAKIITTLQESFDPKWTAPRQYNFLNIKSVCILPQ